MFTKDNTEGFSEADLEILNDTLNNLMYHAKELSYLILFEDLEELYSDKILNAWSADASQNTVKLLIKRIGA